MSDDKYDLIFIKECYYSLLELQKVFVEATEGKNLSVKESLVVGYEEILAEYSKTLPNLLTDFEKGKYLSNNEGFAVSYYVSSAIRAHIGKNIAKTKVRLEDQASQPVLINKDFNFINDPKIKIILTRDYLEIQKNLISNCWKSAIILSGGAIEAILLDVIFSNSDLALSSKKAPKEKDINKWDLNSLIDVSVDLNLVEKGVKELSHSVRGYRNLIHPGNEKRSDLRVEPEEARIAVQVLNMLIRNQS